MKDFIEIHNTGGLRLTISVSSIALLEDFESSGSRILLKEKEENGLPVIIHTKELYDVVNLKINWKEKTQ